MVNMAYCYVFISKHDNQCFQVAYTNNQNWVIDDEDAYNFRVDIHSDDYLGKYYYAAEGSTENAWWSRTWNEYDDDGNPVESAGYVDSPWTTGE